MLVRVRRSVRRGLPPKRGSWGAFGPDRLSPYCATSAMIKTSSPLPSDSRTLSSVCRSRETPVRLTCNRPDVSGLGLGGVAGRHDLNQSLDAQGFGRG